MSKETSAEWFDKSWNPISGRCPNKCTDLQGEAYCYMWRKGGIADRFKKTHDHPLCLNETTLRKVPKSGRILVGSSTDMFCDEVSTNWLREVFYQVYKNEDKALFTFLTKKPKRYKDLISQRFLMPLLAWYGTTYDGTEGTKNNIAILKTMKDYDFKFNKFVSFEPLLANPFGIKLDGIDWIIIGADSRKGKPKPPDKWADYLVHEAWRNMAKVFVKNNYRWKYELKELPEYKRSELA